MPAVHRLHTYSVASGTLPNGLSLNSSNGAITGTPTAAGALHSPSKLTDGQGQTASHSLSVAEAASILSVTTTTLSNGIAGVGYSSACTATGGVTPYTFAYQWRRSTDRPLAQHDYVCHHRHAQRERYVQLLNPSHRFRVCASRRPLSL